jgi:UMF1 family MFS transporter
MYPLGFIVGFVLGGVSSYCRALFGELIPAGSEAAFYALYAITDKGSSAFGPAIVGAIINYTGQIRSAFWFLAFLIALPAPLLWWIDVKRGGREGRIMSEGVRHAVDGVPSATSSPPSGDSSRERGRTINARE